MRARSGRISILQSFKGARCEVAPWTGGNVLDAGGAQNPSLLCIASVPNPREPRMACSKCLSVFSTSTCIKVLEYGCLARLGSGPFARHVCLLANLTSSQPCRPSVPPCWRERGGLGRCLGVATSAHAWFRALRSVQSTATEDHLLGRDLARLACVQPEKRGRRTSFWGTVQYCTYTLDYKTVHRNLLAEASRSTNSARCCAPPFRASLSAR